MSLDTYFTNSKVLYWYISIQQEVLLLKTKGMHLLTLHFIELFILF